MSLGPFFRSPFTDLTGSLINHQLYGRCAEMELKLIDCLEAYGFERGKKKCSDIMEDFQECVNQKKQLDRYMAMRMERHRQYIKGESKEHYATPPRVDSY